MMLYDHINKTSRLVCASDTQMPTRGKTRSLEFSKQQEEILGRVVVVVAVVVVVVVVEEEG